MDNKEKDTEILLISLLILALGWDDDPSLSDKIFSRLVRRIERSRFDDPELMMLLERLHFERPPFRRRFREVDHLINRFENELGPLLNKFRQQLSEIMTGQNALQKELASKLDFVLLKQDVKQDVNQGIKLSSSASELGRRVEAIKRHTVQIEAICLATILFVVLPQFQQVITQLLGATVAFLLPFPFLAGIAWLAPVVNPEDSIRSRIKWGLTGLGAGATLGGGIAGAFTLGVGAPVGALIGGVTGFIAGSISGPALDGSKPVFTQGEAREYLMEKRKRCPGLDFKHIIDATEHPPNGNIKPIPMFLSDGVIKCAKEDIDKWLSAKSW